MGVELAEEGDGDLAVLGPAASSEVRTDPEVADAVAVEVADEADLAAEAVAVEGAVDAVAGLGRERAERLGHGVGLAEHHVHGTGAGEGAGRPG